MTKTAIILAAGRGSRLDPGGQRHAFSKPLISVGGQSLLSRTITNCRSAGVERIIVVTGFNSELVTAEARRLSRGDVETVYNPDWRMANGLSLYACRHIVNEDFFLMMSDHVFDADIMRWMGREPLLAGSVTLAVDYKIGTVFDLDDATKVVVEDGRIAAISKQLETYNAIDCGLFRCTPAIFDALGQARDHNGDCSLSQGMAVLAERDKFRAFDIGNGWWQDVDTPDMRWNAEAMLAKVSEPARSARTLAAVAGVV